jgi:hypothetical protein
VLAPIPSRGACAALRRDGSPPPRMRRFPGDIGAVRVRRRICNRRSRPVAPPFMWPILAWPTPDTYRPRKPWLQPRPPFTQVGRHIALSQRQKLSRPPALRRAIRDECRE